MNKKIKTNTSSNLKTEESTEIVESDLKHLIENAPFGYAMHKMVFRGKTPIDYIFIEANHTFERITGLKNVIGKRVSELFPDFAKKSGNELLKIYSKVSTTGKSHKFDTHFAPLDRWLSVHVISNKKGYFSSIFQDITAAKKTSISQKETESALVSLINSMDDLIFSLDINGVFTHLHTPKHNKKLYLSPEYFIGKKYTDLNLPSELVVLTSDAYKLAKKHKRIPPFDYSLIIKGEENWFNATITPVFDKKNNHTGMTVISRDITSSRAFEIQLKESETRFRTLLESTGTLMAIAEGDGTISYANKQFYEKLGYSNNEIIGKKWFSLVPEKDRNWLKELGIARLKGTEGIPNEYEQILINKSGAEVSVYTSLKVIPGTAKTVISCSDISKLKRIEKESELHQERLLSFIDSATEGFILLDKKLNYILINKMALNIFPPGTKLENIIGKNIAAIVPDIKRNGRLNAYKSVLMTGTPFFANDLILGKKFKHKHVSMRVFRVGDGLGQVFSDITDAKQAEEEINLRNQQYFTLISNLQGMAYRCKNDKNWTMNFISQGCKDLTGYTSNDLINNNKMSFNDLVLPKHQNELWNVWQKHLKQKKKVTIEYQIKRSDGKIRWVHETGIGVWNDRGKLTHLEGYIFDITDRKEAQNKLIQSEAQYRNILVNMSEGYYEVDLEGCLTYFNDSLKKMLEYSDKKLKGMHYSTFIRKNNLASIEAAFQNVFQTASESVSNIDVYTKNGTKKSGEISISIRHDLAGAPNGFKGIIRDVTEKIQNEKMQSVIYEISEATHTAKDMESLYKIIHTNLSKVVDATSFYIAQYDEETQLLSFPYYQDTVDTYPNESRPLGKGLTEYVIRHEKPLLLTEEGIKKLAKTDEVDVVGTLPKIWIASPLRTENKTVGVITMQSYENENRYTEFDLKILNYISDQIAVAMERKRDATEKIQNEKMQSAIYEISEATHTAKDMESLYKIIHTNLSKVVDATSFYIAQYDEETQLLSFPYYQDTVDTYPNESRPLGKGLTEYVIRHEKPLLLTEEGIKKLAKTDEVDVVGTLPKIWIASPLRTENKTVGVITMQSYENENRYTEFDLKILNYISDQIAVAMKQKIVETKLKESERKYRLLSEELEESNQFKELLIDIVGHDLKNPAGVVQGFSGLLLEENADNEIAGYIYESSKNMVSVFNDVMVLSKTFSGKKLPTKSLSLKEIIKYAEDEFETQLEKHDMKIINTIKKDYTIQANLIITEVFKNFISNAIKYASEGKKITIKARKRKNAVVVSFSDIGQTIPEEQRKEIFNRLVQVGKTNAGGMGLGLAIVKRIAKLHNAHVWAEENLPVGNTFCIELETL